MTGLIFTCRPVRFYVRYDLHKIPFPGGQVNVTGYPQKNVNGTNVNGYLTIKQANDIAHVTVNGAYLTLNDFVPPNGESGGPLWTYNGTAAGNAVGIAETAAYALNISQVPSPESIQAKIKTLYKDPPADNARVTSAVVLQSSDVDAGQTVQFVLNLSENVTVTGSGPTLTLNDGGTATYDAADSTGTELEFDYNVGASDQTSNLEITQVNSTQTVQAPGGASIDFTVLENLPTDLSINSPLTVESVASSQTGEAAAGQLVQLTLTMREAVSLDTAGGAPTLTLNDGATATYDAAASNPSAGKLVFDYTVGSGDETANLEVTLVNLPSGTTIQDAAGYNADFSAAIDAPTGLQVGPAYITAINSSQSSELMTGETLQLTLAMSTGVKVNTAGGSIRRSA